MHIKTITITDFKSYKGAHTISFENNSPGLYLITGENREQPRLGANGVGKSTILDALHWCLYGYTPRPDRGKAKSLLNWDGNKGYKVEVVCEVGGSDIKIARQWRPNSLQIDEGNGFKEVDQDYLEDVIEYTPIEFTNTYLIGQFNPLFFDLTPTQKLQVFSNILKLEYWEDLADNAKNCFNEVAKEQSSTTQKIDQHKSVLDVLKEEVANLKIDKANYTKDSKEKLKELRVKYGNYIAEYDQANKTLESFVDINYGKELCEHEAKYTDAFTKYSEYKNKHENLKHELQNLKTATINIRGELKDINEQKEDATCPECGQSVDTTHLNKIIKKHNDTIKKNEQDITKITNQIESALKQQQDAQAAYQNIKDGRTALLRKHESHLMEKSRLQTRVSALEDNIDNIKQSMDKLKKMENPYDSKLQKKTKDVKKYKSDIKDLTENLHEIESEMESLKFWIKGFKDIRLKLLDENLTSLSIEINNHLQSIGMQGWSIDFDVERENKSGGITKGFIANVFAPRANDTDSKAEWSGGEGQRLRLATSLGLASVISSNKGTDSNIMFLDEPTQHLSDEGIQDFLDVLKARALDMGIQIWLVDHRSLDYGGFSGKINVVKDKDYSKLIEV